MVMKQLSFKFNLKCGKNLIVVASIIADVALFVFMVYYILWGTNDKIEVFCFLTLYLSTSNIFNFYLIKSKSIKYNSNFLYIENDNGKWEEIPIKSVIKIKRTYYYFYSIYYEITSLKKVVFFISPNPSFFKSRKVKEILDYASK
jgi:hypothetical protein